MPVNEYGEFDEQVYDYTGESVLNINKTIIERLKEERKLIKSESITHSYPHCRRCHTPLISKAMSSRFIKEQEMNASTRKAAETINFVPESVKNRFVNGLQQAPDWNIARNRYRGSPLPIWQNVDDENDRFSVGSLEEMYQLSRTGSKNIIKHILIRHEQTDYNVEYKHDSI
jgi:isoleucyl-tRNA synthetase